MEISCIYIKKTFCQKSKLKTNITSPWPSTTLYQTPAQLNIQSAEKLVKTCLNTLCPDFSITNKDKVEKVKVLSRK